MRITHKKVGGLHFINLNNRFQISFCRLTRYTHPLDCLDSGNASIENRVTRFLSSPMMREAREVESAILGLVCIPVVLIWSVLLVELSDRMNWF